VARRIVHGARQVRPRCRYCRVRGVITRIHHGIVLAQADRAR
jgi:hypothetical protein